MTKNIICFKRTINKKTTIIYFIEDGWKRFWWNDSTNSVVGFFKHMKTVFACVRMGYTVCSPNVLETAKGTHKKYIEEQFAKHDKAQEMFEKIKNKIK